LLSATPINLLVQLPASFKVFADSQLAGRPPAELPPAPPELLPPLMVPPKPPALVPALDEPAVPPEPASLPPPTGAVPAESSAPPAAPAAPPPTLATPPELGVAADAPPPVGAPAFDAAEPALAVALPPAAEPFVGVLEQATLAGSTLIISVSKLVDRRNGTSLGATPLYTRLPPTTR